MVASSQRHPGGRPRQNHSCPLGERIESLALKRGMALDQLAAASGLSFTTLHRIRAGRTKNPSVGTLMSLATALGVPLDKLLTGAF
ncbi:MAG: XRE family transcriptional regulator [Planctomycetia bacterium]|nr:XRE family transcriptional regulator [Planctomycetia bacterium]